MKWHAHIPLPAYFLVAAGFVALQAVLVHAEGHPLTCTCGTIRFWVGDISSQENSQQLTDWYTFSHIIHGFGFYLLLWLIAPRTPVGLRLALAVGLEATWEVMENSEFIINRYRQSALAQGYFGDSVVNSISDTLAALLGFVLASRLPVWLIVALAIAMEVFTGYMIRDNLTLNIIQLIYPSDVISRWQAAR